MSLYNGRTSLPAVDQIEAQHLEFKKNAELKEQTLSQPKHALMEQTDGSQRKHLEKYSTSLAIGGM